MIKNDLKAVVFENVRAHDEWLDYSPHLALSAALGGGLSAVDDAGR